LRADSLMTLAATPRARGGRAGATWARDRLPARRHLEGRPAVPSASAGETSLRQRVSWAVAGAGAPGATLAIYFAANPDQGFVDAITQAVHDTASKPSVMSISWGSAESGWTSQAVTAMTSAFQDAAEVGVSIFAASGDGLAADGVSDGKAHVDFPASSPWVVG